MGHREYVVKCEDVAGRFRCEWKDTRILPLAVARRPGRSKLAPLKTSLRAWILPSPFSQLRLNREAGCEEMDSHVSNNCVTGLNLPDWAKQ